MLYTSSSLCYSQGTISKVSAEKWVAAKELLPVKREVLAGGKATGPKRYNKACKKE